MEAYEDVIRRGGETALLELQRFFMGEDKVHQALHRITSRLDGLGIPYAIAGQLNPYVWAKYTELWDAVATSFDYDR